MSDHLRASDVSKTKTEMGDDDKLVSGENIDEWRGRALDTLVANDGVFILEVYTVRSFVLQIKISINGVSMELSVYPWSIMDGRTFTKEEFRRIVYKKLTSEIDDILRMPSELFFPNSIVSFVINNYNSVPTIVSSNYVNLMRPQSRHKRFMEHFIFQEILPGSQRCYFCKEIAIAIQLDAYCNPHKLYCSTHVQVNNMTRLYNPLLIAFTAHRKRAVLSALNLERVYSPRFDDQSRFLAGSADLALIWTALCKKDQPYELKSQTAIGMYYETGRNVLLCERQHFFRKKYHTFPLNVRHSLTCCLLKTFLFADGNGNKLCNNIIYQPEEDAPYDWLFYNKQRFVIKSVKST